MCRICKTGEVKVREFLADTDEGPRPDSSLERLAAEAGIRRAWLGHGRQQFADVGRRRCRAGRV